MEINNTRRQLFRYRKAHDYSLDELESGYIYLPSNVELNDPFDASHMMLQLTKDNSEIEKLYEHLLTLCPDEKTRLFVRKTFQKSPDQLRNFVIGSTAKFISTYGISCFTVSPIHIPMWAMYADNHEGICIQYDIDRDTSFFKNARAMNYVEKLEIIEYRPISTPQDSINLFYQKFNLWEKEFEIRVVKPFTGKHPINKECVRSIVLGLRAKEDYIERVIDIVTRNYRHAILYKAELMTDSFGLSFRPFKL